MLRSKNYFLIVSGGRRWPLFTASAANKTRPTRKNMMGLAESMGFDFCTQPEEADLILFNTCAVRESAQDRVFGWVGSIKHLKQKKPELLIALFGCMTQIPETAEKMRTHYPYVDIIAGAGAMHRFPLLLHRRLGQDRPVCDNEESQAMVEGLPVFKHQNIKVWLPIMQGCDNYCSYCIVPFVRGREVSRDPDKIVREAEKLIADGCKEITLLGQNVNSYGKDWIIPIDFF
jgi:tRNA-2-methylthio-N6-dimethylallyladenosine synthase